MKFLRCNLVEGTPMTRGAYNKHRGWKVPANENPKDEGFLVTYPDGYESWCPKARFLEQSFPLHSKKGDVIDARDIPAWQITGLDLVTTISAGEKKPVTLLQRRHPTGFVEHESATCVNPENYSEMQGAQICAERIDNKLWNYLGFMLAWARNGIHEYKPQEGKEVGICSYDGPLEPVKAKKKKAK